MVKPQNNERNKEELDNFQTFSTPKIVVEPTSKEGKKLKRFKILRGEEEFALAENYLDNIQKILPRDLGVIHRTDFYPDDRKKERRYKKGVQRAKNDLKLLSFLIEELKPRYRNQILLSDEFNRVLKKYLGISSESSTKLSQKEKDQALVIAIQMLGNSLDLIKKNMPIEFQQSLNNLALPFANLIDSISLYARSRDRTIPKVLISKNFIPK